MLSMEGATYLLHSGIKQKVMNVHSSKEERATSISILQVNINGHKQTRGAQTTSIHNTTRHHHNTRNQTQNHIKNTQNNKLHSHTHR